MSYVPEGAGGGTRDGLGAGLVVDKKYRLEALLGQGAMGAVWAATHLGLGEPVAIKFIDAKFASSPDTRQRFETEAKATAKIRSRFVVTVFDMGQLSDGTLYLVMERLHGETLHAYVKRRGVLSLAESVEFACHVGRALSRAHGRGVIHRDIKPANIFLSDTPDDGRIAKVLDFGVAKLLLPLEGLAAGQTSDGALLGTPQYMSPEQARGRGGVDHHTDIYSLGLVFYRMFTGKPPRPSGPVGELIARVLTEPLPKLCDGRADASPALEAWFARACAAEPSERFESVEASVEALVRAAGIIHPLGEGPGRSSGHGRSGSRPSFDRTSASVLLLSRSRSSAPCLPPPPGEPVNMPALPPPGEPVNMSALPPLGGAPSEGAVAVSSSASSPNLAGNDEASIATGATSASLPTSRQNEKGPAAKRRRSSAAWVFGALSLATVVFFLGAALSRARGQAESPESNGAQAHASQPVGAEPVRGAEAVAPLRAAERAAPPPAVVAAAVEVPPEPVANEALKAAPLPTSGRSGRARGAASRASSRAVAHPTADAAAAPPPVRESVDLGY